MPHLIIYHLNVFISQLNFLFLLPAETNDRELPFCLTPFASVCQRRQQRTIGQSELVDLRTRFQQTDTHTHIASHEYSPNVVQFCYSPVSSTGSALIAAGTSVPEVVSSQAGSGTWRLAGLAGE